MSENWWDQPDMSSLWGEPRKLYEEIIAEVQRRLAAPESKALRNKYIDMRMADPHPSMSDEGMRLLAVTGAQMFANLNAAVEAVAIFLTERYEPEAAPPD